VTSGLAPVFSLSLRVKSGALSEFPLAQRLCTAHPSSKIVHVLSHQMGRLADDALSQKMSGLASS